MTEDILVTVAGLHTVNGDKDPGDKVEVTSAGKYYKKNGKHYIFYDEADEQSGTPIRNRIKLGGGIMEVQKKGAMTASMTFEMGRNHRSWYTTPFGSMLTGIEVTEMKVDESDKLIDVDVKYILEMNYEHVSDADIHIRVMAKDSGLFRLV